MHRLGGEISFDKSGPVWIRHGMGMAWARATCGTAHTFGLGYFALVAAFLPPPSVPPPPLSTCTCSSPPRPRPCLPVQAAGMMGQKAPVYADLGIVRWQNGTTETNLMLRGQVQSGRS